MSKKNKNKKRRTPLQKIVNVFLYTGIVMLVLFTIFFAISQTSTFRNYLKDYVVEKINNSINGKLTIGQLEGTIITTIYLRNTVLSLGNDTLLNAGTIELKTSPLDLLLKRITVRKAAISNAKIRFIKESDGNLNFSGLIKKAEPDTSTSSFHFKILVSDFELRNISFYLQSYKNINNSSTYDSLNFEDLRVDNLNLRLNASADIANNKYEINLKDLFLKTNLSEFSLSQLSGKFLLNKEQLSVNNLLLRTSSSEIFLNADVNGINLFDKSGKYNLKNANVTGGINGEIVLNDFSDLVSVFRNSMDPVSVSSKFSGKVGDLLIKELELSFSKTHLQSSGKLLNLDNPSDLVIKTGFFNSYINQPDVPQLFPELTIPSYEKLGLVKIDTLNFDGKPLNFFTNISLSTPSGNLYAKGNLNLEKALMSYNLNFATANFDISPIAGILTKLNSRGKISGVGTDPANLKATMSIYAEKSTVGFTNLDSLIISMNADKKNILYNMVAKSDTSSANISGIFDFSDAENPGYDVEGTIKNLDYSKVFHDTNNQGRLNFYLNGTGQNLDPDKLNLYMSLMVKNSVMNGISIDSSQATFNIMSLDSLKKSINITSDLADISINGNFSLPKMITMISSESELLLSALNKKLDNVLLDTTKSNPVTTTIKLLKGRETSLFSSVDNNNDLDFNIKLKDFNLISIFLKNQVLAIDGQIDGKIENISNNIKIKVNTNLESLKFWGDNDVFFLSNLSLGINLSNIFEARNLSEINSDVSLSTSRIFAGSDIHNLDVNFSLSHNIVQVNLSGKLEDYLTAKFMGKIDFTSDKTLIDLDTLGISYNNYDLINQGNVKASVSRNELKVSDFLLYHNSSKIKINGDLLRYGDQNMILSINHVKGNEISANFANLNSANNPDADINLKALIKGNFDNPLITMQANVDSVFFKNNKLGNLNSEWSYKNKNLNLDIKFLDASNDSDKPALKIFGNIPIDLTFFGVEDRIIKSKEMDIKILADKFNLKIFGEMLPGVKNVAGFMDADLKVSGNLDAPNPNGFININKGAFLADANNLEYKTNLKLSVAGNSLSLDSLVVKNSDGTQNGGTLIGNGNAILNNFEISSSQIYLAGQLKILSEASKAVSPTIYGDLVISTNGKLELTIDDTGTKLTAPINVEEANLTVPQSQRGYKNNSSNFIYRYVQDTVSAKNKEIDFESLIALSQKRNSNLIKTPLAQSKFEYSININIKKDGIITFILDQEFNQILTTVLNGNFKFQKIAGRPFATGELRLIDGSTLEFLTKTFQAEGSLRFESELSNPYLNIVAIYRNYYIPPSDSTGSNEEEVAVKIKLKGPLKELNKNFVKDENNIAVYMGADNIENDIPDKTKDASDAITFLVTNSFLNSQGGFSNSTQNNAFASTASSIAGSLLGNFLNSYTGDYIKSLELRRVGSNTKFNLSGRVNNFRYSIGGTTEIFSDLTRANVKIEYPFFQKLFLRLERKEAITETNNTSEMVNELGLKYKFEF